MILRTLLAATVLLMVNGCTSEKCDLAYRDQFFGLWKLQERSASLVLNRDGYVFNIAGFSPAIGEWSIEGEPGRCSVVLSNVPLRLVDAIDPIKPSASNLVRNDAQFAYLYLSIETSWLGSHVLEIGTDTDKLRFTPKSL